jgi:hypothetical protein
MPSALTRSFTVPREAAIHRQVLMNQYVAAFRHVEAAALEKSRSTLGDLVANISWRIVTEQQGVLKSLVDRQLAKLG